MKEPTEDRRPDEFSIDRVMPPPEAYREAGADREFMMSVKPDYARVRKIYLMIASFGTVFAFIMQAMLYFVFKFQLLPLEFKTTEFVHILKYWAVPSFINISITVFAHIFEKKYRKNEFVLNLMPVLAVAVICGCVASAHSVYSVTMVMLCLPIFMSAVYGSKRLTDISSIACLVDLLCAFVCRLVSPYRRDPMDTKLYPEFFISLALLLVAYLVSLSLINLLDVQKTRLIKVATSAQNAKRQAQAANEAKTEFLANMSHEIRTPLNAIIGLTEMVVRKSTEEEVREYAADIQQSGNILLSLINDILDISKIESGKMEIREENYELGSLIHDSYNVVAARWQSKGLTATVTCDPNLPRVLHGDEYHLRQIVVNLLTNAIKYTNDGGVELHVSGEENNDILRLDLIVKDTGIGIKEEDMPNLFGKFSRLEMDRNRRVEGSGLGLAITKQLVELMHGTIEVDSTYGVGSTFTVRVPQKIVDATPIGDIRTTYLNMRGNIEEYKKSFEAPDVTILAVDDVAINLTVIAKLLEETKIKVDFANSGQECLVKVCEKKYDLILMDHMMPKLDGVQTLAEMKKLPNSLNADTPVIMLTANALVGVRDSYLKAGFADYLSKPVRGAKLEQMLVRYIPEEKIVLNDGSARNKTVRRSKKANEGLTYADLATALPEMNKEEGLTYCANDENFHCSMLVEFATGKRDQKLQAAFDAEDWHSYQIEAHSLKSAAKMVGLSALSNECFELELAAKTERLDYIKEHHKETVDHYAAIVSVLSRLK